ncbi:MAG: hypothetical protein IJ706_06150 [Clostridia bacterium]|nr:hypothetical protein [Clostridia bacterium]
MKKKTRLFIALSMCAAISASVAGVTAAIGVYAGETWEATGVEISDHYDFGSTFNVPDYVLKVGGRSAQASFNVECPDGTSTADKSVLLDKAGTYSVRYFADIDGVSYFNEYVFDVDYLSYTYLKKGITSVDYGHYSEYGSNSDGLLVRLAGSDVLTFTKLIDVRDLTSENRIISGFITPDERGVADFDKLTVTLTDSVDPSVYFKVDYNRWKIAPTSGKSATFVMAGGNGQVMVGYEEGKGLHVNDGIGATNRMTWIAQSNYDARGNISWSGPTGDYVPDKDNFYVTFDNDAKKVYSQGVLVSDLDSAEYYNNLWSGFKSGYVRLSVSASNYAGATANFCITQTIAMDNLTDDLFFDYAEPEITVDTEYDNLPEAAIGKAYKIPSATAYDYYSGNAAVNVKVWYNYASSTPVSVNVNGDTFTPDRSGYYTIEYTACDAFGNECVKTMSVHAGGNIAPIDIAIPETAVREIKLGNLAFVPYPEITGGSGNYTVKTTASLNGNVTEIENEYFRPETVGDWTIRHVVTDYIGNSAVAVYKLKGLAHDDPVFVDEFVLPAVYIAGVKYVLPEIYANIYSTGKIERKLLKVDVTADGTTSTYNAGDEFIPEVSENKQTINVRYYYGDAEYGSYDVPVIIARDGNTVYVKNYFYGDGFTIVDDVYMGETLTGIAFVANESSERVGWTFANPQLSEGFNIKLLNFGSIRYKALEIILRDAEYPDLAVAMTVGVGTSKIKVESGEYLVELDGKNVNSSEFTLGFENSSFKLDNLVVTTRQTIDGKPFNGFVSNKVYVTLNMLNAKKGAAYQLKSITGTNVTNRNVDTGSPTLAVLGDIGGSYAINSVYVLAPAVAADTFSPYTSLTVTVTVSVNGEDVVVSDVNGVKLDGVDADREYTILLDNYGYYQILYYAREVDWTKRNNDKIFTNYVAVIDEEAPEIIFKSGYKTTAKVGDVISFPTFAVKDNISGKDEITITRFVLTSQGKLLEFKNKENSIKVAYEGVYRFSVVAYDKFGNMSIEFIYVTVTK